MGANLNPNNIIQGINQNNDENILVSNFSASEKVYPLNKKSYNLKILKLRSIRKIQKEI